jgi:ABC-type transporter Mla subunit MlaD
MVFNEASKVDTGTPVRMKGVQIGNVVAATLYAAHVDVVAEVADASNIVPQVGMLSCGRGRLWLG